jgi:hypothetical protein
LESDTGVNLSKGSRNTSFFHMLVSHKRGNFMRILVVDRTFSLEEERKRKRKR